MDKPYIKNGFSLFWGGPYSQWDIVDIEFEGVTYNCAEQFMMAGKALICGDSKSHLLIMDELFPDQQKKLGKKVEGWSEEIWNEEASMMIVYVANYFKFTQNEKYNKYLMADPSVEIVEASPYDTIWGIGLGCDRPQAWHKNSWKGENRLGRCIDQVRNFIKDPATHQEYHDKAIDFCKQLFK